MGASCISLVERPLIMRWVVGSIPNSEPSTTGLTNTIGCANLSGMVHIKYVLLLIRKSSPCSGGLRFSRYLSGPLPYV